MQKILLSEAYQNAIYRDPVRETKTYYTLSMENAPKFDCYGVLTIKERGDTYTYKPIFKDCKLGDILVTPQAMKLGGVSIETKSPKGDNINIGALYKSTLKTEFSINGCFPTAQIHVGELDRGHLPSKYTWQYWYNPSFKEKRKVNEPYTIWSDEFELGPQSYTTGGIPYTASIEFYFDDDTGPYIERKKLTFPSIIEYLFKKEGISAIYNIQSSVDFTYDKNKPPFVNTTIDQPMGQSFYPVETKLIGNRYTITAYDCTTKLERPFNNKIAKSGIELSDYKPTENEVPVEVDTSYHFIGAYRTPRQLTEMVLKEIFPEYNIDTFPNTGSGMLFRKKYEQMFKDIDARSPKYKITKNGTEETRPYSFKLEYGKNGIETYADVLRFVATVTGGFFYAEKGVNRSLLISTGYKFSGINGLFYGYNDWSTSDGDKLTEIESGKTDVPGYQRNTVHILERNTKDFVINGRDVQFLGVKAKTPYGQASYVDTSKTYGVMLDLGKFGIDVFRSYSYDRELDGVVYPAKAYYDNIFYNYPDHGPGVYQRWDYASDIIKQIYDTALKGLKYKSINIDFLGDLALDVGDNVAIEPAFDKDGNPTNPKQWVTSILGTRFRIMEMRWSSHGSQPMTSGYKNTEMMKASAVKEEAVEKSAQYKIDQSHVTSTVTNKIATKAKAAGDVGFQLTEDNCIMRWLTIYEKSLITPIDRYGTLSINGLLKIASPESSSKRVYRIQLVYQLGSKMQSTDAYVRRKFVNGIPETDSSGRPVMETVRKSDLEKQENKDELNMFRDLDGFSTSVKYRQGDEILIPIVMQIPVLDKGITDATLSIKMHVSYVNASGIDAYIPTDGLKIILSSDTLM